MQAELNPCPFCTSQPYRDKQGYVRCVSSDCPMRVLTMHETVWNTRPIPTPADMEKWEALREAASKALAAVDGLIAESHGVCGLHLNGDVASWGSLTTGGQFEDWLSPLGTLRQALAALDVKNTKENQNG